MHFFSLMILMLACGGSTSDAPENPAPTDAPPPVESGDDNEAAVAPWGVTPTSIRYSDDDHLVSVQADIDAPDGAERTEPVYVGVTVITPEGEEIDLMVQTLFPGAFDQGVLFTTSIDGEVQDVLIGVWGTKIEPCEVDRYGCREFGFVLDNSLGSWPKGLYTDAKRRRIPPAEVAVVVKGQTDAAERASKHLTGALQAPLAVFGSKAGLTVEGADGDAPATVVVSYGHKNDELLALDIADAVKGELTLTAAEVKLVDATSLGSTFVVELQ